MVKCIAPWTDLGLTSEFVTPCGYWFRLAIGHPEEFTDFNQIWNHPVARFIRHQMLTGHIENICAPHCPGLNMAEYSIENFQPKNYIPKSNAARILENIKSGKVNIDSKPLHIALRLDSICNLTCIMCLSVNYRHPVSSRILKLLETTYGELDSLCVSGGEPFYSKRIIEFLEKYVEKRYKFKISLLTNLTCIDFGLLAQLKLGKMEVSIDGATKSTYEKIRKGACWEDVQANLKKLIKFHRKRNKYFKLQLLYTVISSNFYEIPRAIELYESMGIECIFYPVCLPKDHSENIFTKNSLFKKLKDIVEEAKAKTGSQVTRASLERLQKLEGRLSTYKKELREKNFKRDEYLDKAISTCIDFYKI